MNLHKKKKNLILCRQKGESKGTKVLNQRWYGGWASCLWTWVCVQLWLSSNRQSRTNCDFDAKSLRMPIVSLLCIIHLIMPRHCLHHLWILKTTSLNQKNPPADMILSEHIGKVLSPKRTKGDIILECGGKVNKRDAAQGPRWTPYCPWINWFMWLAFIFTKPSEQNRFSILLASTVRPTPNNISISNIPCITIKKPG